MSSIDGPANPQEAGFQFPTPELANLTLPPGQGRFNVPHVAKFSSIVNLASRTYRWTSDEALRDSETNAKACLREPVIWEAVRSRQYPTVQMPWHISPLNPKRPEEAEAAYRVEEMIKRTASFQQFKRQHLDAIWFGKSGVNAAWQWDYQTGSKALLVRDWLPLRGDKIVWKFSGRPGIRVWGAFKGHEHGLLGTTEITDKGMAYFPANSELPCYIIHKFEPEDADHFDPELAGSLHGNGVRGRIYWLWHQRTQVLAWMLDYLELVGAGGFTIAYYQAGDPKSEQEVSDTMSKQLRNHIIMFPRYAGKETGGPGLERIEPSTAGANLLKELITDYYDSIIRRYITGPYLSSEITGSGMGLGEGTQDLLVGPFARIVKYDCTDLADTYCREWVPTYYRACYPNLPPGQFQFDVDKPNAAELAEAANVFYEMGGDLDAEHLRDALGLPEPDPDGGILAKAQPMSVQGVDPHAPVAGGIPQEGTPGPEGTPAPNGEPVTLQRLKLSRRGRDHWWGSLGTAQKCDVLSKVVSQLLRKKAHDEPIKKSRPSEGVTLPSQTYNITTPPINMTVESPQVHVAAPAVHVDSPKVSVGSPTINVASPQVSVASPTVNVASPTIKVASPTVKVAAPAVKVEAPVLNVAAPQVTVEVPAISLPEVPRADRRIEIERDKFGNMTSAKLVE